MRTAGHASLVGATCSTSYRSAAVVPGTRRRRCAALRCKGRDDASEEGVALQEAERRPLVIKPIPAARSAAPPPQPVPVEHSSAFLLQSRQQAAADAGSSAGSAQRRQQQGEEPFNGSAVEWVLRKADESLDEIEENPPEFVKTIYEVSSGPIGKTASATVTTAAKATVLVGANALKAAAPVGKWALQQGFKLAVGAVSKGFSSAAASGRDKKKGDKSK